MKRYQIVNRPEDGLELRQLDETARHINELWARLTEFGDEFKKTSDTLAQAAGSLAGRVTVLENPPVPAEPPVVGEITPPVPTVTATAAGGFIAVTAYTSDPVDSYDCQLQEEAVVDPPTDWQNTKSGTFSIIPPLPNTNYIAWARSRRAYLQSEWGQSEVVNSGYLPYLLLDASNDPLTGTLEISLPPQPGQSYLESPALSIRYIHDMTAYDLFKIWDNSGGLGEGPWLSLGIWSGETGWPPSMPVFGYFNVDYGPKDGGVSATLETTDSSGNQTGRISFYDSGKAFVNKDGDSLFQHGVFENSINVTGTGDYSCAVYIAEYSGNAAIEYYYYTTSWLKYAYQNVSGFFIDWTNYDEPGFWIGDTEWRDGLWLQTDGFSLLNYSGSEFGSSNENAWINSGSLTLYSFSEGTPPFVLTGNNTGVLVTGLNSDLLDGYHASGMGMRHGFASRTDNTLSFVDGTRICTVAPTGDSFDLYLSGVLYEKTSSTTTIPNTAGLHYIYFDSAGDLQNSMSAWDITSPNAPVVTIYWNGAAGAMIDERHGADRNLAWHEWAHLTIGTRYQDGLAGTFGDTTFAIASGKVYDEDLDHAISAQTACRLFYRSTGTFTFESGVTTPYKAAAGVLQYDNGGSLSNVTAGRYITNWVYAGGDTAYPIYIIVSQAEYTTLAAAETASPPSLGNLPIMEMKLLYGIIYRYQGGNIIYQSAEDYRTISGPAGTYIATDHGALAGLADDDHPQYMLRSDLGSGTDNYIPKFLVGATPTFADSIMSQTGTTAINLLCSDAVTDAATDLLVLKHDSSDTPTTNFGSSILWQLDSDTQEDRDAAEMTVSWTTATDATRTSKVEIFNVISGVAMGYFHSPYDNTNLFVGYQSGNRTLTGTGGEAKQNCGVGFQTSIKLTTGYSNVALGYRALYTNQSGYQNVAIGAQALYNATSSNNMGLGWSALYNCSGGYHNIGIGYRGGYGITGGYSNVCIGTDSGFAIANGSGNTIVGRQAGWSTATSLGVYIGYYAGYYETAASKLFIDNAQRASEADGRIKALIYGIFASTNAAQYLTVNGNFINQIESTDTNAVRTIATLRHNTTGVVANGLGTGLAFQIETSTTENTDAARISSAWVDSTHATRKANMILSVYDTAIRTGLTIAATGSGATLTVGGTLTVGADDAGHDVTLYGATAGKKMLWDESADTLQLDGTLDLNGGATLGSADTDAITCTGRLIVRTVNDGDMDATDGTTAEVVFNSADSKFYGCTASGTPATWAALN